MRNHRITKSDFRPCSTCMSCNQALFCLYTLRTISDRTERTFERLRYSLGGDRPSQTVHLTVSHYLIQGSWLESQYYKGGIPRMAPHKLTSMLHSLPPILCMHHRIPVSSWSKAPWGLSVLAQVTSIFTGISISPGALSRQRSNHYAFRAGRNLPDKEFRYLRTVIVTAAVYWGFNSKLRFP